MQILLGFLLGLVASMAANLLTPGMKPLWATILSLSRRGIEADTRQKIKVLQSRLDQVDRFRASERDLYLYLSQCVLAIIAILTAAALSSFMVWRRAVAPEAEASFLRTSEILLVLAFACCLAILLFCRDFTTAGMKKTTEKLTREIETLRMKLPRS